MGVLVFLDKGFAKYEAVTVLEVEPPYSPADEHSFVISFCASFSGSRVDVRAPWMPTERIDILVRTFMASVMDHGGGVTILTMPAIVINNAQLADAMKPMMEKGRPIGYNDGMQRITTTTRFCAALMEHFSRIQPA